jgi:hypothetical protein
MKNLLASTTKMLDHIEAVTGRPVQFLRDETLPLLATLKMARNGDAYHVLRYQATNDPLDYLVTYQAAFVLRLYENAPENRFDFAGAGSPEDDIKQLLSVGAALDDQDRASLPVFATAVTQWALMTLRSMPVGMKIDLEIAKTMPELREQQRASIQTQLEQNLSVLGFSHGRLSVPQSFLAMPAAYAKLSQQFLGETGQTIPYEAMGLDGPAQALLDDLEQTPSNGTGDQELTDRWAARMGMTHWYQWKPFTP